MAAALAGLTAVSAIGFAYLVHVAICEGPVTAWNKLLPDLHHLNA